MDGEKPKEERLAELLERNLALTEEIYKMTKSVKGYVNFQKVMSVIYFLLIVVPIILSAIYLPPLLKGIFSQYGSALGGDDFLKTVNPSDLRNVSPEIRNLLEN
ncbi:MAG: hypothetical protein WC745_02790 [Patescibacteria group bacterium]|jgi:hypothetical protein